MGKANGRGRLKVTSESPTGRNTGFLDTRTGQQMTAFEVALKIRSGQYENYHLRNINGVPTPVSNPDKKKGNNLG